MPDARKVRPVAPLDAERREAVGWNENEGEFARSFIRCPGYDHDAAYSDAEFAAHFMPAELFDAVLTAARAQEKTHAANLLYFNPAKMHVTCTCDSCIAVRAFDAYLKGV